MAQPYDSEDLELVCELARRAALAIDNARLYSEVRGVEERLAAVLVNLAEAITVVDDARTNRLRQPGRRRAAGRRHAGRADERARGTLWPRFLVLDEQGRELDLDAMPGRRLFRGEQPEPLLVRNIVRATGEERWLIVRSSAVTDPQTQRILYAVNVFENITEVKRAQLAESFMAEASRAARLLDGLRRDAATRGAAGRPAARGLVRGRPADDRGEIERVAIHHSDPAWRAEAERRTLTYRQALDEPTVFPR